MSMVHEMVMKTADSATLREYLNKSKFTHLLIREDLFLKYLKDNFSEDRVAEFLRKMASCTTLLYRANGYGVYQILP